MASDSNPPAVAQRAQPDDLSRALDRAFATAAPRSASVGIRCGRECAVASIADERAASSPATEEPLRAGCLAKLLTATLALRTLAAARIALDTFLVDVVDVSRRSRSALRRVTLRHLLEHTHGLDDSLLDAPRYSNGFVDLADLDRRITAAPPLADAGSIYSYGSVGAWLVTAALERAYSRTYTALLTRDLLEPIGAIGARGKAIEEPVCPASGGELSMTIQQWLSFLRLGAGTLAESAGACAAPTTPLPGWAPLERGVRLGWKHCGGDWFGHQSVWPRRSAFVRVSVARDTELAVFSRDHPSAVVAARVFGDVLPELFDLRPPGPAPTTTAFDVDTSVGHFASARFDATITRASGGVELCVHDRLRRVTERAPLAPAAGRILFVRPPTIESFHYVQLVSAPGGEEFLWNGRFVLRRL